MSKLSTGVRTGSHRGCDGFEQLMSSDYIFVGALFLYTHPNDAPVPSPKTKDKTFSKKLRNRLVPAIFVGISTGPGCQWELSYKVVPLASLLSEKRASRVSIRTVADVHFSEVVYFPL